VPTISQRAKPGVTKEGAEQKQTIEKSKSAAKKLLELSVQPIQRYNAVQIYGEDIIEVVESEGPNLKLSSKRPYDSVDDSLVPPTLVSAEPIVFSKPHERPAYQRYAHLIQKPKTSLELPRALQNLISLFVALESVINYMKSRDTIAVFHKIQSSVQDQARLNFELKHLAQIVYIYPDAYKLSGININMNDKRVSSVSIEFFSDILKEDFVKNLDRASQPLVNGPKLTTLHDPKNSKSMMSAVSEFVKQIPIRRQRFEELLIDYVKKKHQVFVFNIDFFVRKGIFLGIFSHQPFLAS
jgi:hypothetical protein